MSTVPWLTVRKHALARSIAILLHDRVAGVLTDYGLPRDRWDRLPQAHKDRLVKEADKVLDEWTRNQVMIQFQHPYAEPDGSEEKHSDQG
jgi:hypothetical protein